jgi:hypothetical protein
LLMPDPRRTAGPGKFLDNVRSRDNTCFGRNVRTTEKDSMKKDWGVSRKNLCDTKDSGRG